IFQHLKMALLSCLRTPGLCGALHYTETRSISSGTLYIKDPLNFWCGGRVNLKDAKTKSEPVYEKLFFSNVIFYNISVFTVFFIKYMHPW
uniref:Uncharacterized protein n=1 Tax=Cyprinus carpio TaxID=7962 RepID=A0A8C2CMX6_CYPCA